MIREPLDLDAFEKKLWRDRRRDWLLTIAFVVIAILLAASK